MTCSGVRSSYDIAGDQVGAAALHLVERGQQALVLARDRRQPHDEPGAAVVRACRSRCGRRARRRWRGRWPGRPRCRARSAPRRAVPSSAAASSALQARPVVADGQGQPVAVQPVRQRIRPPRRECLTAWLQDAADAELELRPVGPAQRQAGVEVQPGAQPLHRQGRLVLVEQVEHHLVQRCPLRQQMQRVSVFLSVPRALAARPSGSASGTTSDMPASA